MKFIDLSTEFIEPHAMKSPVLLYSLWLLELHSVATLRVSLFLDYTYMEHKTFIVPTLKPLCELHTWKNHSITVISSNSGGEGEVCFLLDSCPSNVFGLSNWLLVTGLVGNSYTLITVSYTATWYNVCNGHLYSISHKYCYSSYIPLFCIHCYIQVMIKILCLWSSV